MGAAVSFGSSETAAKRRKLWKDQDGAVAGDARHVKVPRCRLRSNLTAAASRSARLTPESAARAQEAGRSRDKKKQQKAAHAVHVVGDACHVKVPRCRLRSNLTAAASRSARLTHESAARAQEVR